MSRDLKLNAPLSLAPYLDTRILVLSRVASLALPLTKQQSSRRLLHYMTAAPEPLSHPLFAGCAALPCCVWTASSWELPSAIPLNLEVVPADEIMVIPTNHLPRSWVRNKKKRLRAKIFTAVTLTQLSSHSSLQHCSTLLMGTRYWYFCPLLIRDLPSLERLPTRSHWTEPIQVCP